MSGSVLLDTNVVIGILAKDEAILSRLPETEAVFLPSIALGELYFGAFKSAHPDNNAERIDRLADSTAILYCDGATALHLAGSRQVYAQRAGRFLKMTSGSQQLRGNTA